MRTLSRIAILSVFTPFLVGQMCGAPGPVAQDLGGGLDPGLYSGSVTSSGSITIMSPSDDYLDSLNETRISSLTVTANGLPATTTGQEIAIGVSDAMTVGAMSLSYTVTGLTSADASVYIFSDAVMTFTLPSGTVLTLTGVATDVYRQSGDQIQMSSEALLGGTLLDAIVTFKVRSSGTLTR